MQCLEESSSCTYSEIRRDERKFMHVCMLPRRVRTLCIPRLQRLPHERCGYEYLSTFKLSMTSRMQLFKLKIQQACFFIIVLARALSSLNLIRENTFQSRLTMPANKSLSGMLSETTAVVKTRPLGVAFA